MSRSSVIYTGDYIDTAPAVHVNRAQCRTQWQDWLDRLALERVSDEQPDGTSRGVDWSEA